MDRSHFFLYFFYCSWTWRVLVLVVTHRSDYQARVRKRSFAENTIQLGYPVQYIRQRNERRNPRFVTVIEHLHETKIYKFIFLSFNCPEPPTQVFHYRGHCSNSHFWWNFIFFFVLFTRLKKKKTQRRFQNKNLSNFHRSVDFSRLCEWRY